MLSIRAAARCASIATTALGWPLGTDGITAASATQRSRAMRFPWPGAGLDHPSGTTRLLPPTHATKDHPVLPGTPVRKVRKASPVPPEVRRVRKVRKVRRASPVRREVHQVHKAHPVRRAHQVHRGHKARLALRARRV